MKCRLKTNLIADSKFFASGTVVDDQIVPEHLRASVLSYDLEDMGGKVMVLQEVHFTRQHLDHDGILTRMPVMMGAGELVPEAEVQPQWEEGVHFTRTWSPEQRKAAQEKEHESFLKQIQPDTPPATYEIGSHSGSLRK